MAMPLKPTRAGFLPEQSWFECRLFDVRLVKRVTCKRSRSMTAPVRTHAKAYATEVDVAIIGGGPGGLSAAAAVTSAFGDTLRVQVYESQKSYKPQGSVIALAVNCQHALEAIHPSMLSRFTKQGILIHEQIHCDITGKVVRASENSDQAISELEQKYRKRPVTIGWHECRQLLFDQLPSSTVEFDKQMTHYEEDDKGIILHFDRGQPSVHAKVLVGADGYFSKVRAQCLDDGPPTFNESVLWRARVGWQEGMPGSNTLVYAHDLVIHGSISKKQENDPEPKGCIHNTGSLQCRKYTLPGMHMWTPSAEARGALVMPMGTMESTRDKGWTWILMAPMADVQKAGVHFDPNARTAKTVQGDTASRSALENALKVFPDFPPVVMDMVRRTDPSSVTQHGLYTRDLPHIHIDAKQPHSEASGADKENSSHDGLQNTTSEHVSDQKYKSKAAKRAEGEIAPCSKGIWGRGRVTLVGDAAHATINNGQGFCLAVEDGVVLAWHLRAQGLSPKALRRYEEERLPRVKTVYVKGKSAASAEDKEDYLYKPTFKPLWQKQEDGQASDPCITDFVPMQF